jgi:hypothetical protein
MHVSLDEGLDALEIYFGSRGNRSGKLKNIDVKPVGKLDQFLHERVLNTRCSAALPDPGLRVVERISPPRKEHAAARITRQGLTKRPKSTKIGHMNCLDIRIALIISIIHRMVG